MIFLGLSGPLPLVSTATSYKATSIAPTSAPAPTSTTTTPMTPIIATSQPMTVYQPYLTTTDPSGTNVTPVSDPVADPNAPVYGSGTYAPATSVFPPPSTTPTYGAGTFAPESSPGVVISPTPPPPPGSSGSHSGSSSGPMPAPGTSPVVTPVSMAPTAAATWPPTCPAGTQWDDNAHSCIGYAYTDGGYASGGGGGYSTSSAGPNVYVRQDVEVPPEPGLSRKTKIALVLFGIGALGVGLVAALRRR